MSNQYQSQIFGVQHLGPGFGRELSVRFSAMGNDDDANQAFFVVDGVQDAVIPCVSDIGFGTL